MSLLKCKAGDILVNQETLELKVLVNPDLLLDDIERYAVYRPLETGDYLINKNTGVFIEMNDFSIGGFKRHLEDFRLANDQEVELFKSGKPLDMYVMIAERKCKKCSTVKEVDLLSEKFTAPMAQEKLQFYIQNLKPSDTPRFCEKCKTITFWEFISFNFRNIETKKLLVRK